MSVISNYYPNVHKQWNLPIELNDSIIKPEEFREKADDPSSLRYYLPVEEGLQIYHNQPTDKYQVGLVDLKNRSILDCDMKIVDKNLILSSGNNTIVKVENLVTSQATRKVMFAFNDAIVFNPKCIFVACNQEGIIEEFNQEANRVSSIPQMASLISALPLGETVEKDNLDSVNTLHYAVITNNHAMAQLLISKGTDIEARDNDGRTPLSRAVSLDKSDMVQLLLNKGADIEAKDNDGRTPLSRAVTLGNLNMVQLLLNKGAYIYSKDGNGKTIFEIAHEYHRVEIVNYLITKGDKYGNTILHYAAEEGNLNLVELLLDNNTHISVKNSDGWIPLHLVVKEGKLDVVELLMRKGANIDAKDNNNQTPLHIAVQVGNFDTISLIVNKIESINFERSLYAEPGELVGAVRQRERLKFLISEEDRFGYTPLQYAAKEGKWDIVNFFLDKTAERGPDDVANKDQLSKSWTTVHYAVYNGNLNLIEDIFQFLSDKDSIINTKDSSGWTPLHYAAFYGTCDVAEFLVGEGSSIEVKDRDGKTPLEVASSGAEEMVKCLINCKDKDNNTPLYYAAAIIGYLDRARFLLENGANINAKNGENQATALHGAVINNNLNVVQLLLGNDKVDIEAKNVHGWRPLHYAAISDETFNMVKVLVEKGADISAETNDVKTPLEVADKYCNQKNADFLRAKQDEYNSLLFDAVKNGSLDKVKDLLNRGANIETKDKDGKTLLDIAIDQGHDDIVEYLKKFKKENKEPVQRKRRHHHGDYPRHYDRLSRRLLTADLSNQPEVVVNGARQDVLKDLLQNDEIDYTKGRATSGASKPSSWHHHEHIEGVASEEYSENIASSATRASNPINNIVSWVKNSIGGLFSRTASDNQALAPDTTPSLNLESKIKNSQATSGASKPSSWIESIVNWIKGSTESPALLTSREHDNITVTSVPEINATLVNNTIILGILAAGLFNKTQHKQPIHENLLSPREQSMRLNNIDEDMIRAMQESEELGDPNTDMDEVEISGNKTGMWKGGK